MGIALLATGAVPSAAGAGSIESKSAEAARLTDDLRAQAQRIVASDQRYRQAQGRLADSQALLRRAQTGVGTALARQELVRTRLRDEAIKAYTQGGSLGILNRRLRARSDLAVYDTYLGLLGGIDRTTLEGLRAARQDLETSRASLERTAGRAGAEVSRLAAERADLDRAEAQQEALLHRANGELASMVASEQARRAAQARTAAARAERPTAPAPAPVGREPARTPPPGGIDDGFACIRQLESGNNYATPGSGAYGFLDSSWHAMGGTGSAGSAPPEEQDARARALQSQLGWKPWTTARRCGLL